MDMGFYAAGYPPPHIEQIVFSPALMNRVNGKASGSYNYYYTQKDQNASWIHVRLAVDSTLSATLNSPIARGASLKFRTD